MLGAGLAEIGDVAEVGVATESTGTVPACGEDKEEGPGGVPPTMFCRGERGLCPVGKLHFICLALLNNEHFHKGGTLCNLTCFRLHGWVKPWPANVVI